MFGWQLVRNHYRRYGAEGRLAASATRRWYRMVKVQLLCGSSLLQLADQPRRLQLLRRPMHRNPHAWPKQLLDGEALLALLEAVF